MSSTAPRPQSGILPEASPHALFLTLDIRPGAESMAAARALIKSVPTLTRDLAGDNPDGGLVSAVGIGSGAWSTISGREPPRALRDFQSRNDGLRKAPATPTDLMLHIRAQRPDLNFELARRILTTAPEAVIVRDETPAFRYFDARDLTGFVDGTENPEGDERAEVALVGDEDPDFRGGSHVILQRYVHDLARWKQLDKETQEKIIGRTRDTDEELDDAIRPDSAHISRVVIEDDGEELEILRHSLPWGGSGEAGLVFIAYSRDANIFDRMLDRMFNLAGDGVHDNLMDYTQAMTGAYYFVPSLDQLENLA
ncbi:MAG: Dyp-type peroxidase [Gammaproteobacteria bacterium]